MHSDKNRIALGCFFSVIMCEVNTNFYETWDDTGITSANLNISEGNNGLCAGLTCMKLPLNENRVKRRRRKQQLLKGMKGGKLDWPWNDLDSTSLTFWSAKGGLDTHLIRKYKGRIPAWFHTVVAEILQSSTLWRMMLDLTTEEMVLLIID